jgi:hypothetical protein
MKLIRGILKLGFITQGIGFVVVGLFIIYPTAERIYNAYLGGNLLNEEELIIIIIHIAISMWFLSNGFITLYVVAPLPFFSFKPRPKLTELNVGFRFAVVTNIISWLLLLSMGLTFLFRQEATKSPTKSSSPPVKQEQSDAIKPGETSLRKKFTNTIGMEFVLISAGKFKMGSGISPEEVARRYGGETRLYKDEHPEHIVVITKSFYLQKTEVADGQWKKGYGV